MKPAAMPRPRFQKAAPELRDAIVKAARREFAAAGYEAASLNRILGAAGLSKGAFYYYFDDKVDLAATVLLDALAPLLAEIEIPGDIADAEGFWAAGRELQRKLVEHLEGSREAMDLMSRLGAAFVRFPELAQKVLPATLGFRQRMVDLWRKGQQLGAVRKDVPAEVLIGVIQGMKEALGRALLPQDRAATAEELEKFTELVWSFVIRCCAA